MGGKGRTSHVAAVVGAALIWSTSFTATKIALAEVPPLTIGTLRFGLAALALGLVTAAWGRFEKPEPADAGRLVLGGILGTTIYFSMENFGVDFATATDAVLLVASYPAVTMVLEMLVYRTRVSPVRFVGVGLAVAGVYLIVSQSPPAEGEHRLIGDLILVAAGIVWASYNFVTRKLGQTYSNLTVVSYQTAAGAVAFLPLAFLERGQWQLPSLGSSLTVAYLAIFCSVAAFLLYAYGLRELDSGSAVNLLNLVPVFGVAFAFVVLKEPVGILQLLGGLVVVAGVLLGLRPEEENVPPGRARTEQGSETGKQRKKERLHGKRLG